MNSLNVYKYKYLSDFSKCKQLAVHPKVMNTMLDVGPTMLLIISQNEEVSFHLLYWITNRDCRKILVDAKKYFHFQKETTGTQEPPELTTTSPTSAL